MHGDGSKDYVLMLIAAPGHAFLEYMDSNFPDFDFGLVFTISHCLTLHCGATNKILSDIQTVFCFPLLGHNQRWLVVFREGDVVLGDV